MAANNVLFSLISWGTNAHILAQVNVNMPRSSGDSIVHVSHFDWAVRHDCPLPCISPSPPNDIEIDIGKLIANRLIDDGATIQVGIGNIPDAILCSLTSHKNLGVHTDIISDGMVELAERGSITNKKKTMHTGRMVASMALGTKKVYDFLHNNPFIEMLAMSYVSSPNIISKQPKMTSINSCIEMDITGQVCSDSFGTKMYNGFGAQLDFLRGAAIGRDGRGKAIIAFPSVTSSGESKIQPVLKLGGGVVTTRAHAHYIVTEYGVAELFGKTLRQRANSLIQIAHPAHRECLERAAFERFKVMPTRYL